LFKYNISLLYVENKHSFSKNMQSLLQPLVSKILTAYSYENALKAYKEDFSEIIVISQELEGKSGLSLCKEIKKLNPKVKIILTATDNKEDVFLQSIEIGIHGYLKKPFTQNELHMHLERISKNILEERKKTELFNLYSSYKKAVDLNAIVSKTDPDGVITYVNEAFLQISGYKKEELIGQPHSIIRHSEMQSAIFKELWETIQVDKKPWYGEVRNKKKDGSSYYVKTTINPILDADNNVIEYIAIRSDITEIHE